MQKFRPRWLVKNINNNNNNNTYPIHPEATYDASSDIHVVDGDLAEISGRVDDK